MLCVTWQSEVDRKQIGSAEEMGSELPPWPAWQLSLPPQCYGALGRPGGSMDGKGARSWGVGKMEDFGVWLNAEGGKDGRRWTGLQRVKSRGLGQRGWEEG